MNNDVVTYLKGRGIKVIPSEDIETKLAVWGQWYRGNVDKFHSYRVYSGKKHRMIDRKSLNMASRVCHRWADLMLNEKCEILAGDQYTNDRLNELLHSVNFPVRGNNLLETAFALGGGFFIEYWDGAKTGMKYITQDYMYPITFDSGRLIEAAFASRKTIGGKSYVYLETHMLDDRGQYVVDNVLLQAEKGGTLQEVPQSFYEDNGIIPKWETGSETPLFQMIRPNVANRDDFNSPFGTSIFAGSTDILKAIDIVFDSYCKEFLLGKKRIFVQDGVANFNIDPDTGKTIRVFDPNDEVFYSLPSQENDKDKQPPIIHESDLHLRTTEHDAALQTQLNLLSQSVGFGSNGFKWQQADASTATQIISENSEMFRTLKKHEMILQDAVIDMAHGLLFIESTFGGDKSIKLDDDISVNFDDSIIEDTAEIKRQALLELNAGLIDAVEYYQTVYKMTEQQAIEFRDKIRARAPAPEEEAAPEV